MSLRADVRSRFLKPVDAREDRSVARRLISKFNGGSSSSSEAKVNQLSPRKKALARRKQQQQESLRPQQQGQSSSQSKRILFRFENASVTAHNSQSPDKTVSRGKLLTSGRLEVYRLNDVTYIGCGDVTYAILPKSHIMRTHLNKFIITLSNPPSFWHIKLQTSDSKVIGELEEVIAGLCDYANFYDYEDDKIFTPSSDDTVVHEEAADSATIMRSASVQSIASSIACLGLDKEVDIPQLAPQRSNDSLDSLLDLFDVERKKKPNLFRTPELHASPEPAPNFDLMPLTPQSMDVHDGHSWLSTDDELVAQRSVSGKALYSYLNEQNKRMGSVQQFPEAKVDEEEIYKSVRRQVSKQQPRSRMSLWW